jgi:hypothetical protein
MQVTTAVNSSSICTVRNIQVSEIVHTLTILRHNASHLNVPQQEAGSTQCGTPFVMWPLYWPVVPCSSVPAHSIHYILLRQPNRSLSSFTGFGENVNCHATAPFTTHADTGLPGHYSGHNQPTCRCPLALLRPRLGPSSSLQQGRSPNTRFTLRTTAHQHLQP